MSFGSNMVRGMHFDSWIKSEFEKRRKGKECLVARGSGGACERCGFCCHGAPGALSREDIDKIAEFLKITPSELVGEYLTLHDQAKDHAKRPCPIREGQDSEAGHYLSSRGSWDTGPCVFYEEKNGKGSCRIHPVKPDQCRTDPKTEEMYWPPAITEDELEKLGFTTSEYDPDDYYDDDD